MKYLHTLLLCASLAGALIPASAQAGQTAYTVRSTEIKKKPFSDAATVATLNEKSSVDIQERKGGWVRITSKSGNGWVKLLSLRSTGTGTKQGDNGLQNLINIGRTGSSGITVATGVRGLSEEDITSAQPNEVELEKLKEYAVDKARAERFARDAKLKSQQLDYLPSGDKS